ncbi:MAG: hypothetical protein RBU30_16050, partial [Polyangia bacterium]|nr:hypothetical protein [Polyangia bacterium]
MERVTEEALRQIERAVQMYRSARTTAKYDDLSDLPDGRYLEIRTVMAATLQRWAPEGSPYLLYLNHQPDSMLGPLQALRRDYADGVLIGLGGVVRAELFSDFMEMAKHLLSEGYKDAAAVIVGSVLEGHLRSLCATVNIPVLENGKA